MSSEIQPLESISNDVEQIFYNTDFMLILERNLPYLIDNAISRPVEPEMALKFKNDFDGLCIEMDINHDHIWIIMRMNGLRNCYDFDGRLRSIKIPDENTLTRIVESNLTTQTTI